MIDLTRPFPLVSCALCAGLGLWLFFGRAHERIGQATTTEFYGKRVPLPAADVFVVPLADVSGLLAATKDAREKAFAVYSGFAHEWMEREHMESDRDRALAALKNAESDLAKAEAAREAAWQEVGGKEPSHEILMAASGDRSTAAYQQHLATWRERTSPAAVNQAKEQVESLQRALAHTSTLRIATLPSDPEAAMKLDPVACLRAVLHRPPAAVTQADGSFRVRMNDTDAVLVIRGSHSLNERDPIVLMFRAYGWDELIPAELPAPLYPGM